MNVHGERELGGCGTKGLFEGISFHECIAPHKPISRYVGVAPLEASVTSPWRFGIVLARSANLAAAAASEFSR